MELKLKAIKDLCALGFCLNRTIKTCVSNRYVRGRPSFNSIKGTIKTLQLGYYLVS